MLLMVPLKLASTQYIRRPLPKRSIGDRRRSCLPRMLVLQELASLSSLFLNKVHT